MKNFEEILKYIKQDPYQLAAYQNNNSLVIKAGPGSGKSTVLSLKLARLLKEKVQSPRKVACITFSNEATSSLERKVKNIVEPNERHYFISTIHSFCLSQILKPFVKLFNYGIKEDFRIISDIEKKDIVRKIKEQIGIPDKEVTLTEMDKERTYLISGLSQIQIENYDLALKVAVAYEKHLIKNNLVDFISIVKISTQMIQNESYIRKCLEARFPWILIDEYQDLVKPLHEMVLCLTKYTRIKMIAVGDPDQSIYGFNGAIPDFFEELVKKSSFDVIELRHNYRSEQKILDESSKVLNLQQKYISKAKVNKTAEINLIKCNRNQEDQYKYIVDNLIPNCIKNCIPYGEIAILLSSKEKLKNCMEHLISKNIPYYISNKEYPRTQLIIWLEDCMAWLIKTRNIHFQDIFKQWLSIKSYKPSHFNEINKEKTQLYRILIESIKLSNNLLDWLKYIYINLEIKKSLQGSPRYSENFEGFKSLYVSVKKGDNVNLSMDEFSVSGIQGNKVALLTRHSSKGLEYEVIILPFVEDGSIPNFYNFQDEKKMEEEKRILFVCLTRAKTTCYLLMSKKMNGYPKKLSRFLDDFNFDTIVDL